MEKKMKISEWDIKIYCQKHQQLGKKKVQKLRQTQDAQVVSADINLSDDEALHRFKMENGLRKQRK